MGCPASKSPGSNLTAKQRQSFHEKYRLGRKIGRGAFAQVRLATNMNTGRAVAVKIIDLQSVDKNSREQDTDNDNVNEPKMLEVAGREAMINQKLGTHKYVVQMLDDPFVEGRFSYIVMERCDLNLWAKLEYSSQVTEGMLAYMFRDMLLGIAYIHSKSIVHRDIKPDNFLCHVPTSGRQRPQLKLCDFGLSGIMHNKDEMLTGVFGTPAFMSPEMLSDKACDEKTDMWSMSILVYVFLLGQFPYAPRRRGSGRGGSSSIRQAIREGRPPANFEVQSKLQHIGGPSSKAVAFLRGIFSRDKSTRISAKNALRLPFLSEASMKASDAPPCLKPMIFEAKKIAHDPKSLHAECEIDSMLHALQKELQRDGGDESPSIPSGASRSDLRYASTETGGDHKSKSATWDTFSTGSLSGAESLASFQDDSLCHTQGDLGRLDVHSEKRGHQCRGPISGQTFPS